MSFNNETSKDIDQSTRQGMRTENSVRYRFADFTLEHYRRLVSLAAQHYLFCRYASAYPEEGFLLWRHDVDFSVHRALKLAEIEHSLGVNATYFIHPHSEFYNFFERSIVDKVLAIVSLGHDVGLHFDADYYGINDANALEERLSKEKTLLESVYSTKIGVFSFHNPSIRTAQFRNTNYAGMVNTYSSYFLQNVSYCSDSNGYWRFESLDEAIINPENKRLQVLTHPEWWQDYIMSPEERIMKCIYGRCQRMKERYDAFLKLHERNGIDW